MRLSDDAKASVGASECGPKHEEFRSLLVTYRADATDARLVAAALSL